jgi:ribosomal protein S18 acetylase RimI-like enzyme
MFVLQSGDADCPWSLFAPAEPSAWARVMEIRSARADDVEALWAMLFYASHGDHEPGASIEGGKANPGLARYVAGFGAPTDFGYVACAPAIVGAAWARLFAPGARGYGWVDDETPELAIAIAPAVRGRGVGSGLLERLIAEARGRFPALSLSVRADNPALRLYERFGFRTVAQVENRVGGLSSTMVLRFDGR